MASTLCRKEIQKINSIVVLLMFLASCDCNQEISGTVLDLKTKTPLDRVYVQNSERKSTHTFTNERGEFKLSKISGGIGKCPPMKVAITKHGYEIKIVEIESQAHDTIFLDRVK